MNSEWVTVQQRKLDEKITAEYLAVTSPQPPDDEWIYELDANAWQAWARSYGLSRDAGRLQGTPVDKAQGESGAI